MGWKWNRTHRGRPSSWGWTLAVAAMTGNFAMGQEAESPAVLTPAPVVQPKDVKPNVTTDAPLAAPVIQASDPKLKELLRARRTKANPQDGGITMADGLESMPPTSMGDKASPAAATSVPPSDGFNPPGLPWPVAGLNLDVPGMDDVESDAEAEKNPQEPPHIVPAKTSVSPPQNLEPSPSADAPIDEPAIIDTVADSTDAVTDDQEPPMAPPGLESQAVAMTGVATEATTSDGLPLLKATPPMGRITDVDVQNARTASFSGVSPGSTTVTELFKTLGQPQSTSEEDGKPTSYAYQVGPFPSVEFIVQDDLVHTVVVSLSEPASPEDVATELQIGQFRSAPVFDQHGELMAYVFPERGILLNLDENQQDVSQIMIEPIRAQFFVIRARNDAEQQYRLNLADLNYAIQLDPNMAEAYWLKSQIFTELGRYKDALQLAEYAVERAPEDQYYKLHQAKLVALNGDFHRAEMIVSRILSDENTPEVALARSHCLMGDLLASGPKHDFDAAIEHHRAAIAVAAPFWTDRRSDVSRVATQVLIDANLAVANDIAWGRWSKKAEVLPQWIETAEKVIEAQAGNHHLDALLTLQLHRRALMAYAGTTEKNQYRELAEAAQEEADALLAASDDWLFKNRVEWELGEALYQSMRCSLRDGNQEKALEYAKRAVALVEKSSDVRQITTHQEFVVGQLYYLTGSIHALAHENHPEAIRWYRKAAPYLTASYPRDVVSNPGILGDQIVSIGVSFWKTENRPDAIAMTKEGVSLIRKAIAEGQRDQSALVIPYGNLATMCRLVGNQEEAETFATLAVRMQQATVASEQGDAVRR